MDSIDNRYSVYLRYKFYVSVSMRHPPCTNADDLLCYIWELRREGGAIHP